jgi:poly [ADP-ribose] polymerase
MEFEFFFLHFSPFLSLSFNLASDVRESVFVDDEYVVYRPNQQKLRYLIEFSEGTQTNASTSNALTSAAHFMQRMQKKAMPNFFALRYGVINANQAIAPVKDVVAGLSSTNGKQIPIVSVTIRAEIVELLSSVVVFQEFFNNSDESMEAKFTWPLAEGAAVVGLEVKNRAQRKEMCDFFCLFFFWKCYHFFCF